VDPVEPALIQRVYGSACRWFVVWFVVVLRVLSSFKLIKTGFKLNDLSEKGYKAYIEGFWGLRLVRQAGDRSIKLNERNFKMSSIKLNEPKVAKGHRMARA